MANPGFNYQAISDSTMMLSTFAQICCHACSDSSLEHVGPEPRSEVASLPREDGRLVPMPKPRLGPSPAVALSPLLRGSPPRLTLHGSLGTRPRQSDQEGGATPEAPSKLLGPSLHPREAARSLDHRPKDAQGQYLCWDHLCHRGCTKGGTCPYSHKSVPKWSGLDYSVQLQLLRRGGLKGSKAKTAADVEREFTRIRAEQAAKASAAKQEGIETARATAKAKANSGTGKPGCLEGWRTS